MSSMNFDYFWHNNVYKNISTKTILNLYRVIYKMQVQNETPIPDNIVIFQSEDYREATGIFNRVLHELNHNKKQSFSDSIKYVKEILLCKSIISNKNIGDEPIAFITRDIDDDTWKMYLETDPDFDVNPEEDD